MIFIVDANLQNNLPYWFQRENQQHGEHGEHEE